MDNLELVGCLSWESGELIRLPDWFSLPWLEVEREKWLKGQIENGNKPCYTLKDE